MRKTLCANRRPLWAKRHLDIWVGAVESIQRLSQSFVVINSKDANVGPRMPTHWRPCRQRHLLSLVVLRFADVLKACISCGGERQPPMRWLAGQNQQGQIRGRGRILDICPRSASPYSSPFSSNSCKWTSSIWPLNAQPISHSPFGCLVA